MGKRSVQKALLMGVIPILHAYLFYCLCNEAKVKWKLEWLNSTAYALLFILPFVQAYPLYKFFSVVESNLAKKRKAAYKLRPLHLALLFVLLPLAPFAWLYGVYATQKLFNENGVGTLG